MVTVLAKINLSSANWSCSGKRRLNSLPNDKFLDWLKLKAFADDKINVTEKLKFVLGRLENMVDKGENAGYYQHFPLFPSMFSKGFFKVVKSQVCVTKS